MQLSRLYPLRGLPKQGQIWAWISYDVANQSFTLIVNTLLFSIFFSKVVVQDPDIDDRLWALTYGGSMLLTAILSPIAGAIADQFAWKKECLIISGLLCSLLTCALALIGPGQLWLAVLIYVPANFLFSIGENFLASFLPSLATEEQVGRVSGFSWACAYAAALLLLALTGAGMSLFHLEATELWRPFFVFAGLWFLVLTIPTMIWLREPDSPAPRNHHSILALGFIRLAHSLRQTSRFRDLAILLVASLFYGTGMSVVIFFASKLAEEYGFDQVDLVKFVALITISGVIGTLVPTWFQDRVGHQRSTIALVALWVGATLLFAWYAFAHDRFAAANPGHASDYPRWPLWVIGNLLGFGLGSLGSANRAFVGYLAPPDRAAEVFGLWGLVFKLAAIFTFPFAWVKDKAGTAPSLLVLAAFLVVGLFITLFVNEQRGAKAARDTAKA